MTNSIDPKKLAPHPVLDRIWMMDDVARGLRESTCTKPEQKERAAEQQAEWEALAADIARRGVQEPIRVVQGEGGAWLIVDGRHRWRAALQAGLATVPVLPVADAEVFDHIEGSVIARRHLTKSALAWIAVLMHPEVAEDGRRGNKAGNNQHGRKCAENAQFLNGETLAEKYGVSRRLIVDAIRLYRDLEALNDPKVTRAAELALWSGVGIEQAKCAAGGAAACKDKPRPPANSYSIPWDSIGRRLAEAERWNDFHWADYRRGVRTAFASATDRAREEAIAAIRASAEGPPPPLQPYTEEEYQALIRRLEQKAKS